MSTHEHYEGTTCPRCDTTIESAVPPGTIYAAPGFLYVPLSCATCGSAWDEVYRLTGYRALHPEPSRRVDNDVLSEDSDD